MKPVLFHIFDFPVYSYSVFVVLAYLAALGYGYLTAHRRGLDTLHVIDVSLWLFIGGIAGARIMFVAVDHKRFLAHPLDALKIWQGGLVFYGGLAGAVIAGFLYLRRKKLEPWPWADLIAPTAMITLAVGRIGCFLNGCCYGKIAPDLPWGVVYPVSHPALGLAQYPVHPAPLYESGAAVIIFAVLALLQARKRFDGQVFWAMVLLYSAARFPLEYFRGDPRGKVLFLSTSQAMAVVGVVAAVVFMAVLSRRSRHQAGREERRS